MELSSGANLYDALNYESIKMTQTILPWFARRIYRNFVAKIDLTNLVNFSSHMVIPIGTS